MVIHKITIRIPKGEIDCSTVIIRNLNSPLTSVDISSNQNTNKEMVVLNETID